jgi:hypothetical protein
MSIAIRHIRAMVEIWARKDEPETGDLRQAIHIAELLEKDSSSPTHLRSFAWHLTVETHEAVGWDLPPDLNLASCRAAAASLSHSASLLIDEIVNQVHGNSRPVLLLGSFAASRSLFGRWDLLPGGGALLVTFDPNEKGLPEAPGLGTAHGIHWASPGHARGVYEEHAFPAALNGDRILLPDAELIAACSISRGLGLDDPEALIFCGAALEAAYDGAWSEVTRIAKALGHPDSPVEIAVELRFDRHLGLEIGKVQRSIFALRRLIRR